MKQGGRPRREDEKPDSPFGKALKEYLRRTENFTQTELARESGIPEKTLSHMVKGRRTSGTMLRRDLRDIIRVLYQKKVLLTLEDANRLITTIPALGALDRRDPEDAEIIALFDTAGVEGEQASDQNNGDAASQNIHASSDNRDNASLSNATPEPIPTQINPPPVSETTARANRETHQRIADEMATPGQRKAKRSRLFILVGIGLALLMTGAVITYVLYLAHPSAIKPGGGWISPTGKTVKSRIYFAAYAYPTHAGEPAIDHVNFTVYWQGVDPRKWVPACVSHKPIKKDIFACTADLHTLGVPAGEITISFDVYDRQGNHNNSPNGSHTVTYSP